MLYPDARINARAHSFPECVVSLWNRLPAATVLATNLQTSKTLIRNIDFYMHISVRCSTDFCNCDFIFFTVWPAVSDVLQSTFISSSRFYMLYNFAFMWIVKPLNEWKGYAIGTICHLFCQSVREQDYCMCNQPISLKLVIRILPTNRKNWLTFDVMRS